MPCRQLSSVLPRMSTLVANTCSRVVVSRITRLKLRIRLLTFCTQPTRASSASSRLAIPSSQPLQLHNTPAASIWSATGIDALQLALQAGVDQLEIEHCKARRLCGACG